MSFEFFFGLLGLIYTNSRARHKSRLENDWRLFTPFGASFLRQSGGGSGHKSPISSTSSLGSLKNASPDLTKPIFSTLGATSVPPVADPPFGSPQSSSASSVTSSGSASIAGSTATLVTNAASTLSGKKYEFGPPPVGADQAPTGAASYPPGLPPTSSTKQTLVDGLSEPDSSSKSGEERGIGTLARRYYCRTICLLFWFQVARLLLGLVVEKSLLTLDFHSMGSSRIHFLIPALCIAIQVAAVSTIFIRNNNETNWLVPFYSSKDYLIRTRSNFRPKIEDFSSRVKLSIALALILALTSTISFSSYLVHCTFESDAMNALINSFMTSFGGSQMGPGPGREAAVPSAAAESISTSNQVGFEDKTAYWRVEQLTMSILLVFDILWATYAAFICMLVAFYFNLICSIMKARFHSISKIIEDLAEASTGKTASQSRKITTLYLEHNEACELLDESNDFWQYLIFFTYFTYIPAYCYCLYNLFFVEFEPWPAFVTWVVHFHTGFIILLISFSAASVSTELPFDVEVNIATFLHRVRGLTIGYSCYDLFAITNASMSNTAAACASYFLIVADFSRSSVFNLAQMNSTNAAAQAAASIAANASSTQLIPRG